MKDYYPRRALLLMSGVALVVFVGGILLSRQEQVRRIDRDREALRSFGMEAQLQIQRLESLYEGHLMTLGRDLVPDEKQAAEAADHLVGIIQVSLLGYELGKDSAFHVLINASSDGPPPLPTMKARASSQLPLVVLDEELDKRGPSWIDKPGQPLMFHVPRSPYGVAVIMVSRDKAGQAIREWMTLWAEQNFETLRNGGGPDQLREKGADVLMGVGEPQDMPADLVVPLLGRLGNLELASWDVRETVVGYHPLKLMASATLAMVVMLLAFIIYLAQRRQYRLAAQRVSFVNSVSHELRTPLTNIMLNIDLAVELAEDSPQKAAERLALVRRESRRLGRLIENVLTFSRGDKGKLEVRPVPCIPEQIITEVIEQFTTSLERRGLVVERLDEHTGQPCMCDPDALIQILANLISNVEKYVPKGKVVIHSCLADGELVVRISDEGPGIPTGATERIFNPFERVHSKTSEGESGTGLGLFISRDLAERAGGSLKLLPASPDSGSCFELRMPAPPTSIKPS